MKNYVGDFKWVLYQYICDMNANEICIRCGNYAYDKVKLLLKDTGYLDCKTTGYLNGELIILYNVRTLDKKQLIISKINERDNIEGLENNATIYSDDVVLYFA